MSLARRRRLQKVLDGRKRIVDLKEAELASLVRRTREAESAAEGARNEWRVRMDRRVPGECSSGDLAGEYGYAQALDRRAVVLGEGAREAKALEESARREVCIAKMEHKKVETWLDRLAEAATAEELRLERLQADEVAARVARKI